MPSRAAKKLELREEPGLRMSAQKFGDSCSDGIECKAAEGQQ